MYFPHTYFPKVVKNYLEVWVFLCQKSYFRVGIRLGKFFSIMALADVNKGGTPNVVISPGRTRPCTHRPERIWEFFGENRKAVSLFYKYDTTKDFLEIWRMQHYSVYRHSRHVKHEIGWNCVSPLNRVDCASLNNIVIERKFYFVFTPVAFALC